MFLNKLLLLNIVPALCFLVIATLQISIFPTVCARRFRSGFQSISPADALEDIVRENAASSSTPSPSVVGPPASNDQKKEWSNPNLPLPSVFGTDAISPDAHFNDVNSPSSESLALTRDWWFPQPLNNVSSQSYNAPAGIRPLQTGSVDSDENPSFHESTQNNVYSSRVRINAPRIRFPVFRELPTVTLPDAALPNPNFHLAPPKEVQAILGVAQSLLAPLSVIGFQSPRDCSKVENKIAELQECAMDLLTETSAAFDSLYESATLNLRILAGGRTAEKALTRMRRIFSDPYGPQSLRATATPLTCLMLSAKEATPDHLRWKALSMVTLLTGIPAGTTIDDTPTGGFGHVNLVLPNPSRVYQPDQDVPLLSAGADPETLVIGNLYGAEASDVTGL